MNQLELIQSKIYEIRGQRRQELKKSKKQGE